MFLYLIDEALHKQCRSKHWFPLQCHVNLDVAFLHSCPYGDLSTDQLYLNQVNSVSKSFELNLRLNVL